MAQNAYSALPRIRLVSLLWEINDKITTETAYYLLCYANECFAQSVHGYWADYTSLVFRCEFQ